MSKLTIYHTNLLNHFQPQGMDAGFWYDYVSRLSRKDARIIFKRCQYQSLTVSRKPVRLGIARTYQQSLKEAKQVCRRKVRTRYKTSPQTNSEDRRTRTPFNIKE